MGQMSKVDCKYGAPMGRRAKHGPPETRGRCRLFRVNLDSGGYDDGNAYWGCGKPLYCCTNDYDFEVYARAEARESALRDFANKFGKIILKIGVR